MSWNWKSIENNEFPKENTEHIKQEIEGNIRVNKKLLIMYKKKLKQAKKDVDELGKEFIKESEALKRINKILKTK